MAPASSSLRPAAIIRRPSPAALAPLLRGGEIILLIQGNTGGSLVVRRALDAAGCRAAVDIAEMDNYPYSCWRLSPTRIRPIVAKRWLQIAAFPGHRIDAVFPAPGAAVPACHRRADRGAHRLHQRKRHAARGELRRQCRQDRSRRGVQVLRRGRHAVGRPAVRSDQRRTRGGRRGAGCERAGPRRLVRAHLWRARCHAVGDLPASHHQQRRARIRRPARRNPSTTNTSPRTCRSV